MNRMPYRLALLAAVAACRGSPNAPEDGPYLTGIIDWRPPYDASADANPATYSRLRVTDSTKSVERCEHSVVVSFTVNTPLARRSGAPVDTGALHVGQRVSVWTEALFLLSCPPQTGAVRIVVEDVR